MFRLAGFALLCSTLSLACSDGDLPDAYKLTGFRVLALIADKPEAGIGETVTVTPLISDIGGGGRPVIYSAQACSDPGVGLGFEPSCASANDQTILTDGAPVTGLSSPNFTDLVTSTIVFSIPNSPAQQAGNDYLLTVDFTLPDGSTVRSFKRIKVSNNSSKNRNPVYAAPPLTSLPSDAVELKAQLTAASKESYDDQLETLKTSWFVSDGEISITLTDDADPTRFTPPATLPSDRDVVLVAVTRDDRGGAVAFIGNFD